MNLNPTTKIFIIEGIAGAGKSTLHQQLLEQLKEKTIYDYPEEATLFSWKHAWIPNIDQLRLDFFGKLLDYSEQIIKEDPTAVFIISRFHISYAIFCLTPYSQNQQYKQIIERISRLPAQLYIPVVETADIEQRSSHKERTEKIWQYHLQKRLEQKNFKSITEMYETEQRKILQLAQEQEIPFIIIKQKVKESNNKKIKK